jgi:hypothetical protein
MPREVRSAANKSQGGVLFWFSSVLSKGAAVRATLLGDLGAGTFPRVSFRLLSYSPAAKNRLRRIDAVTAKARASALEPA